MATINAKNISVGRDFNVESVVSSNEKLTELEGKIKTAHEAGDKTLVKQLVGLAMGISKKVGEHFVGQYLNSM